MIVPLPIRHRPASICICLILGQVLFPPPALADEPWTDVRLDPVFARFLRAQDALLVKYLHDHSCSELLDNLAIKTDANGLDVTLFPRKKLAFHSRYKTRAGKPRFVLVYDPIMHSWPGTQPETIVITDSGYRLLEWKAVGGSPMFQSAELRYDKAGNPVLALTRTHRHPFTDPTRGNYRFLLADDQIRRVPEVEWIYASQEVRDRYERIRQAIEIRKRHGTKEALRWHDAVTSSAGAKSRSAVPRILRNMPTNSDERCLGISVVAEALLGGKRLDRDGLDAPEDLARRIYDGLTNGRKLRYHGRVSIDGRRVPIDSREALEKLSTLVAKLYKRDYHALSKTEQGRQRLVAGQTSFIRTSAELDRILRDDPDKTDVFLASGKRWFPDGTVKDTYHVILIRKEPGGEKSVYDPNDPGSPIASRAEDTDNGLMIEWTCRYKDTGVVTRQRYRIVHKDDFFRLTLGKRRRDG